MRRMAAMRPITKKGGGLEGPFLGEAQQGVEDFRQHQGEKHAVQKAQGHLPVIPLHQVVQPLHQGGKKQHRHPAGDEKASE